jgi:hypothetical protein
LDELHESGGPGSKFVLPILNRSAVLLNLLLQDTAVDLELASSVVALDPAQAFAVLQLANSGARETGEPVWHLPAALVAAGRPALQELLESTPRLQDATVAGRRLAAMARDGAVRAAVAQWLSRELGLCNIRKSFLGGLLFDIPEAVAATCPSPEHREERMLAALCASLPAAVAKAAMTHVEDPGPVGDPLVASVLLAELIVHRAGLLSLAELADSALWECWPEVASARRSNLLEQALLLQQWASAYVYRVDPWEFMSRLERGCPWVEKGRSCR